MTKMQLSNFEAVNFIIQVDKYEYDHLLLQSTWSFFWIVLLTPSKKKLFVDNFFQKNA